jgi:hypothetical protein
MRSYTGHPANDQRWAVYSMSASWIKYSSFNLGIDSCHSSRRPLAASQRFRRRSFVVDNLACHYPRGMRKRRCRLGPKHNTKGYEFMPNRREWICRGCYQGQGELRALQSAYVASEKGRGLTMDMWSHPFLETSFHGTRTIPINYIVLSHRHRTPPNDQHFWSTLKHPTPQAREVSTRSQFLRYSY